MDIPLARNRLDAFAALMLVAYAALFTALFWVVTAVLDLGDGALTVVLGVLVVVWLIWSGMFAFTWTRMRRVTSPLGLHPTGLVARGPFGELSAPWETVQSAAVERAWNGRRLRIRLVPSTDPRFAEVEHADLNPRMFEVVQTQGMRYSLRILDIGVDQLREAFVVQSGGRVQVS
jgi:hypothetical protein